MDSADTTAIPYGYCHCGCGQKTAIATRSRTRDGHSEGKPFKYAQGHSAYAPKPNRDDAVRRLQEGFERAGVPFGRCQCGCGSATPLAKKTSAARGCVRGYPLPRLRGHRSGRHGPLKTERYRVEDRGYETPCWIWQLGQFPNGYGQVGVDGRKMGAHRFYYEREKGPIPEGLEPDHLCRNRDCVNPDHLEPVTHSENVRRGFAAIRREAA